MRGLSGNFRMPQYSSKSCNGNQALTGNLGSARDMFHETQHQGMELVAMKYSWSRVHILYN
jgi:hypothetical protein